MCFLFVLLNPIFCMSKTSKVFIKQTRYMFCKNYVMSRSIEIYASIICNMATNMLRKNAQILNSKMFKYEIFDLPHPTIMNSKPLVISQKILFILATLMGTLKATVKSSVELHDMRITN